MKGKKSDKMANRFISLWFRHLTTDWLTIRRPELKVAPFVLATPDHGRMIITAVNSPAQTQGVNIGMPVADARVLVPSILVFDDKPELPYKLLKALALWCIRYSPISAVDLPDGLILDISGCAHLWGGEKSYFREIVIKLRTAGYDVRGAMADTIGTAWAIARFGQTTPIIEPAGQAAALLPLPSTALRLEPAVLDRLAKLGMYTVNHIIGMPANALRRRFGKQLLLRLDQALGKVEEAIEPVQPVVIYQERLPCLEPIRTAGGIEIALARLLETLCGRLQKEGKGLRSAVFKGFRVDGKLVQISIGTNRASHNISHLFKLFEEKISTIEPDLGIELFLLEVPTVEDLSPLQESLWKTASGLEAPGLSELIDRLANKVGTETIRRYWPDQRHWPERTIKPAVSLHEKLTILWPKHRPRPFYVLPKPEPIEVTAPIPDYPPMNFRYKNKLHVIKRAEGPERINREWWMQNGPHRDYYAVEDEAGARYWIFRSGHYIEGNRMEWFIHGFFA